MYKFLKFQAPSIPCPARHMEIGCIHKECPVFNWADPEYEYEEIQYNDFIVFGYKESHWKVKLKMQFYSYFKSYIDKLMKEKMEYFNYEDRPEGEGWEIVSKKWFHYSDYVEIKFRRKTINRRGYCGLTSGKDM